MTMPLRKGPLLLVDDDRDDVTMTCKALKICGIGDDVRVLPDGERLLDYLRNEGEFGDRAGNPAPCLILLDLNMPRKNGRETLQELKSTPSLKSIPVVVMSTSRAERDVRDCYELGANAFIAKPMSFTSLVDAMRSNAQYWLATVELPSVDQQP